LQLNYKSAITIYNLHNSRNKNEAKRNKGQKILSSLYYELLQQQEREIIANLLHTRVDKWTGLLHFVGP
jgi:hypothetical protein